MGMSKGTCWAAGVALVMTGAAQAGETLTIATVNNSDMIIMQKLSPQWEKATGNKLNWVVLEENVLRQRVTTDIATNGGQFDIITIGSYETPIWGKSGWLDSVDDLGTDYDYADIFAPVKNALSYDGKLYAVPFYAESSFTFYRTDLFTQAGVTMPANPTWTEIAALADKLTDKSKQQYGICLRGKPGWGENMALVGTLANTFGSRLFDMTWQPTLDSEAWVKAVTFYDDLMQKDGPPAATSNGFNENQALFSTGHCAIWVDATSAAGRVYDPAQSQVADKTGFAAAPHEVTDKGAGWNWAWALALPASSKKVDAAKSFMKWATSKTYVTLVGESAGWVTAPPGTRESTYANANYIKAAPFAPTVKAAILGADPAHSTLESVPYLGTFSANIPEWQSIGTTLGQNVAAGLSGQISVKDALQTAQTFAARTMKQAGYPK